MSNDPSELTRVADWVNAWAQQHQVPGPATERVDLCATEVVTNIMMHGYTDGAAHRISLQLQRQDDRLALEIEDDGIAFDPLHAEQPPPAASLEDAAIGGLGLRLVRGFSDEWRYSRSNDRNYLTLVFCLYPGGSRGHHSND